FYTRSPHWRWSLLAGLEDPQILQAAAWVWVAATVSFTIGFYTRTSAIIALAISTSFAGLNLCIDNAGDDIRRIILFYLMLSPCGAVWSIDHWRQRLTSRGAFAPGAPVFIHPWPLRLLMVQMVLMYFINGMFKLSG